MLARLFFVTALLLLLGSLFATSVLALPTGDIPQRSNPLEPRGQCVSRPRSPGLPPSVPSTQQIKDCATRTGKGGPNTVFYSGGVGIAQARQLSDSIGGTYFDNFIDHTWMLDQGRGLTATQIDIFQKRISAAMAEMSTGTTYIVLPADSTLTPPGSTWTTIEYPLLERSGHVREIVRVHDGSGSGRTVVWTPANGITTPEPHVP